MPQEVQADELQLFEVQPPEPPEAQLSEVSEEHIPDAISQPALSAPLIIRSEIAVAAEYPVAYLYT